MSSLEFASAGRKAPVASPPTNTSTDQHKHKPIAAALVRDQTRIELVKVSRLIGHKARVFDLAWAPVGPSRLLSVGEDGGKLWPADAADTGPIPLWRSGEGEVMRCAWHPRGTHVLTGGADGVVSVWDAAGGAPLASLRASAEGDEVYGLSMLGDEGLLAIGVSDTLGQWDLHRGVRLAETSLKPLEAGGIAFGGAGRNPNRTAYIFGVASRGRVLVAALSDGTARLLDSQTFKELGVLDAHAKQGCHALTCALSPSSPMLATTGGNGAVLLWDLRAIGRGPTSEMRAHRGPVHAASFSAAGALAQRECLVTGGSDCTLRVTDVATGELRSTCRTAGPVLCTTAAHPRGQLLTAGGTGSAMGDHSITCWARSPGPSTQATALSLQPLTQRPAVHHGKPTSLPPQHENKGNSDGNLCAAAAQGGSCCTKRPQPPPAPLPDAQQPVTPEPAPSHREAREAEAEQPSSGGAGDDSARGPREDAPPRQPAAGSDE